MRHHNPQRGHMLPTTLLLCAALIIGGAAMCSNCASSPPSSGTLTPLPAPPVTVTGAVDIATCTVADASPPIVDAVKVLLDGDATVADKVLTSIFSVVGGVARGYACYLKEAATMRAQAGEVSAAAVPDDQLIAERSRYCASVGPDKCRWQFKAAWLLARQADANKVILPTPHTRAVPDNYHATEGDLR